jgi:hypothetical protein
LEARELGFADELKGTIPAGPSRAVGYCRARQVVYTVRLLAANVEKMMKRANSSRSFRKRIIRQAGLTILMYAMAFQWALAAPVQDPQDSNGQDSSQPVPPQVFLQFDGSTTSYVEVPDSTDLSVDTTHALTISAWMRPDALTFTNTQGASPQQFVHWLGKGHRTEQEWTFRMYSIGDASDPRQSRISFYVFNLNDPPPTRGCGSYFQDPTIAGQWIHVVGVVDDVVQTTSIYKNGELRHTNSYAGIITPQHGTAPMRFGTRDFASFFQGALAEVRVWNRVLSDSEIGDLYALGVVSPDGLVAEYLLNEGLGNMAFDTTIAGNDGTILGATWAAGSGTVQISNERSGGGC